MLVLRNITLPGWAQLAQKLEAICDHLESELPIFYVQMGTPRCCSHSFLAASNIPSLNLIVTKPFQTAFMPEELLVIVFRFPS